MDSYKGKIELTHQILLQCMVNAPQNVGPAWGHDRGVMVSGVWLLPLFGHLSHPSGPKGLSQRGIMCLLWSAELNRKSSHLAQGKRAHELKNDLIFPLTFSRPTPEQMPSECYIQPELCDFTPLLLVYMNNACKDTLKHVKDLG